MEFEIDSIDIGPCSPEAIQLAGAIQPHGILLITGLDGLRVCHVAGDVERRLGVAEWEGQALSALIGTDLSAKVSALLDQGALRGFLGQFETPSGEILDISVHQNSSFVILELEAASSDLAPASAVLDRLAAVTSRFSQCGTVGELCERAAGEFRRLTGFDQVMICQFIDDAAGRVIAEDKRSGMHSFLNQSFPASDVPREARARYLRNSVRVIPDALCEPVPLRPAWKGAAPLAMDEISLRSAAPLHLRYLSDMGVRGTASIPIIKDGALWGLVACHHESPRSLTFDLRAACRLLAGSLARQMKVKEEAEGYRQAARLRSLEDDVVAFLADEGRCDESLIDHVGKIGAILVADGAAVLSGSALSTSGACPPDADIRELASWLLANTRQPVFATDRLADAYPAAASFQTMASGLLSVALSGDQPWLLLWFRAEQLETVTWAGNPTQCKNADHESLKRRHLLEEWPETIRGHAPAWSKQELDAARRLRFAMLDAQRNRRVHELNRKVTQTLKDKDLLLREKEFLIGEVNHRVQNSLQLVSAFLGLQGRSSGSPELCVALEEACTRMNAVALVHRRLYRGDRVEVIDGALYLEELCADTLLFMGQDWAPHLKLELSPVPISADRAVTLGLVLAELLINCNKYAYAGGAGPIEVALAGDRTHFRLTVADRGVGKTSAGQGFGTRMLEILVGQLQGKLTFEDNQPGLRAVLSVPVQAPAEDLSPCREACVEAEQVSELLVPLRAASTSPCPALDGAVTEQVIYLSDTTRVLRRRHNNGAPALIVKQAIGSVSRRRLQHERAMLARVAGVDGVVQLAPGLSNGDTLVFRDEAGTSLGALLDEGSLTLDETLTIAISLGRTVASVHRAGIVHKDINPANILVGGCDLRTTLIDFNIASSSTEERAAFTHANLINGTLAYMAPEQTGRTGRTVDQRTDLYALGATLYEMAVGHRPFESDDLLHLLRDQLISKPAAPASLDPTIPPALSDIIMRLLEKEPDARYQSADGLVHDLRTVKQAAARGENTHFTLGECDFPLRICAPSRPIGRDAEIAALNAGVEQIVAGQGLTLLVSGPAGVGKTTLIDEMRSMATACGGWYVSGKFDQYRHDALSAVMQALRSLGRILLAEPEATAAAHRHRILSAVGANAGLGPTRLPEFELLLGELPQVVVADTLEFEGRAIQCTIDLLRGIASPRHPVVMVLDDLQWASAMSLRLLDALVVATPPIPGLMVVGAYREAEVDGDHPLSSMLSQWQELGVAPQHVHLANLRPRHIDTLVGDMLRLAPDDARSLGQTLNLRTNGNPYDTVELINALRAEGLLEPQAGGWLWDTSAIHRYVGDASVMDLLARRIDKLPAEAHALLEIVACLGGGVRQSVLATASGLPQNKVEHLLAPALEEGLLMVEPGADELLRFRHDRVQQAVFEGLGSDRRQALHLALARRFAVEPELTSLCAEQYLPAAASIAEEAERRAVATRFAAAARVVRMSNTGAAERFLSAAVQLIESLNDGRDADLLLTLKMDLHEALYGLGRLPEADRLYVDIQSKCDDAVRLVDATGVQIYSLTNRGRHRRAMSLGLALLARLGRTRPVDMRDALCAGMARLNAWLSGEEMETDLTRPEVTDELVLARAKIIIKTGAAAYLCDPTIFGWLILEAHRSWLLDGPCVPLMSSAGAAPFLLVGAPQDYRGAYAAGRHFLTVGAARGFEPATSLARYVFAVSSLHWIEPIENAVSHFEQARKELTQAGDLHFATYTYLASDALLDSSPTLDGFASEVESGLAYAARSNNGDFRMRTLPRRQLLRALRGETRDFGSFDDGDFDDAAHEAAVHGPSTASSMYHVFRALAAALFDDMPLLLRQTAAAMPVLGMSPGYYITAIAHFLRAVAMAHEARCRSGDERTRALDELDAERIWLAKRAEDAPSNFGHLLLLVEAEQAWAVGELWTACATFDAAIDQAAQRPRPWHRAFITERAGAFHLANGMESSGRPLLERAREFYRTWGAVGKVEQLDARHAFLRDGAQREALAQGGEISADVMDTIAVMRASKALSSETNLNKLTARITGLLSALTGATEVDLLRRSDGNETWFLSEPSEATGERLSAEQAADAGRLPLSVLRYVERTQECLLVDDALSDDRFAGESCWAGLSQCSLLVVPILNQGQLHSMLVLQNRLQRAAFSRDRLDAVMLIAGQLSVSLENALLYASLERKVADRTSALEEANLRLALLSQTDALTGLANRRHFDQVLEVECLRAKRTGTSIGLVMIDVDHFKQYNDRYGHQSGDTCLRIVASALKASMRNSADLIARYGGEEFVLLLPNADLAGAHATAERVRAAVEAMQEPHAGAARNIVTISAGFSTFSPIEGDSASDCLREADAALYAAKRDGRNCAQGPEVDEPQDATWSVSYAG